MTMLHHVLHFLFLALSGAATLIPLFVANNMRVKQIEADIEALKAFLESLDNTAVKGGK